jgi:hypothetical protein
VKDKGFGQARIVEQRLHKEIDPEEGVHPLHFLNMMAMSMMGKEVMEQEHKDYVVLQEVDHMDFVLGSVLGSCSVALGFVLAEAGHMDFGVVYKEVDHTLQG